MNLSQLIDRYRRPDLRDITTTNHLSSLRTLQRSVGGAQLTSIRAKHINECIDTLHAKGIRRSTIAKHIRYWHAIFAWCKRCEFITSNPCDGVRVQQHFAPKAWQHVESSDIQTIIDGLEDRELARAIALCRWAGCRVNEAVRMKHSQINHERRTITITPTPDNHGHLEEGTKGKYRTVPLDPRVAAVVGRGDDDEFVCGKLIYREYLYEVKKIQTWSGQPWHTLRKSCGMDWVDKVPISTVADWMGHSVQVACKHYLRPSDQHFAAIVGVST